MTGPERTRTLVQAGAVGVLLVGVTAVLLGRENATQGWLVAGVGTVAVVALLLWQGRVGLHTPWSTARSRVAPGHAVVLWKPGCTFCEILQRALRRDPRVTWVNVWVDEAANAVVREHNAGNEVTPTVLVGSQVMVNPTADQVRAALAGTPDAPPTL
ncbi:glutaredoxin family protein [Propioniciclava soli]|uniref:glutaredoxin family protein n=1 Tax=Propioniciclava soli TaxID=2775081 RepID=UPI001E505AF4|nr:hypothetical protein [Propioniciclava soli]